MRNASARWVPRRLSSGIKGRRIECANEFLQRNAKEGDN